MRHLQALRIFVPGLALVWAGCGSSATTAPTPSPTPYTEPTTLAFVHLLTEGHLSTYTVSPVTGLLARTDLEDVQGGEVFLAADPKGRFVFVHFLPTGQKRHLLRSYRVLPDTGSLALADQQFSVPPLDLAATDEVVFVSSYGESSAYLTGFVVHQDGFLEAKTVWDGTGQTPFPALLAAVPAGPRVYGTIDDYTVRAFHVRMSRWFIDMDTEGTGWVADEEPGITRTIVAGNVLVAASSAGLLRTFTPAWDEARLLERASVQAPGPLLAYVAGTLAAASADGRVTLYAVGNGGQLTPRATTMIPSVRSLAFHPSGRFLYVSGPTLRTYLVEADGTLRPYDETVAAPGLLAVTAPPSP